jgi:nucleosome assembly protein 1-like 1
MSNKHGKGKKHQEKETPVPVTALVPAPSASTQVVVEAPRTKASEEDIEIDDLPKSVVNRVLYLKNLHELKNAIVDEYSRERAELEKKFIAKLQPLYNSRSDIVTGKSECEKNVEEKDNKVEEKGIPHFWLTAMLHHEIFQETIQEEDVPLMEHLVDLKSIDDEDMKGFTLEFYFSKNEFFTNDVLRKRYKVPNLLEGSEPIVSTVNSDVINWKSNKNLTVQIVKSKSKKGGKSKTQTKTVEKESFFNFFKTLAIPQQGEQINLKDMQKLEEQLEPDFDQALALRNTIILDAIIWYTGEVEGLEFLGEEGDFVDEDVEDEEDDDEESDGEENQIKPVFNFKPPGTIAPKDGASLALGPAPGTATATGAATSTEQPPECKQS